MRKSQGLFELLSDFFGNYLPEVKGVSINTIRSYKDSVRLLFEFIASEKYLTVEKVSFDDLNGNLIEDYLHWLEDSRNCSRATRNQRLAAISSFAKYAMHRDITLAGVFASQVLDIHPKRIPQKSGSEIVYFLPHELSILLNLPNRETITGRRDVALMSVLYGSGARAQELCDLTVNDVTFGTETKLRLVGKGNKARRIAIPSECADLLKTHMKQTGLLSLSSKDNMRHIFSSQRNEHMTIACVEALVAKYVKMAKTKHPDLFLHKTYTPHSFRHSIAVDMLESGCSLPAIKAFLGHSCIQSTMIYATVSSEHANKVLRERGLPVSIPQTAEREVSTIDKLWFLR